MDKNTFSKNKVFLALTNYPYQRTSLGLFTNQLGAVAINEDTDHHLYSQILREKVIFFQNKNHFKRTTPDQIIKSSRIIDYINSNFNGREVCIVPSRSNKIIDQVCKENNWKIIANHHTLSDKFEDKTFFRNLAKKLKLPQVPQITLNKKQLLETSYESIQHQLGDKFVLNFEESYKDGGLQTQFVFNQDQFNILITKVKNYTKNSSIIISKFIKGQSLSMLGCITQYGVLTGSSQLQLIDQPICINTKLGDGIFCGHDWEAARRFPDASKQMNISVQKIGEYLKNQNYKGIFGIDFIHNDENNQIYAIECNPRYTGSFPVYTFFENMNTKYPLEYFHFMELSNQDYPQKNFKQYQVEQNQYLSGSHLNLFNKTDQTITIKKSLNPGLYEFSDQGEINFLLKTFDVKLLDKNKFLLLGGLKESGVKVDKNLRIGRIIFDQSITDQAFQLSKKISLVVNNIYSQIL